MKLEAGSRDWHEWRKQGVGGSDAPIIMGVSRTSIQTLWELKTGRKTPVDISHIPAVARGIEMEPLARAHYEMETSIDSPPAFFVHEQKEYEWMRASLDGYGHQGARAIVLEIKCPGDSSETLKYARQGIVDPAYVPQLAHQQMVTGCDEVHFYVFDGSKGILIPFKAEMEYLAKLKKAEEAFWECVKTDTPPESKYADVSDQQLQSLIKKLGFLLNDIKINPDKRVVEADEIKDILKKEIEVSSEYSGVRISISTAKKVDYKKAAETFHIDLNPFTKVEKVSRITLK